MATPMAVVICGSKMSCNKLLNHSFKFLKGRNILKTLNVRLYCSQIQGDKDDFFGIPEDFELQHYRHSTSAVKSDSSAESDAKNGVKVAKNENNIITVGNADMNSSNLSTRSNETLRSDSNRKKDDTNLVEVYHSIRERRTNRAKPQHRKSYRTNFGAVSLDHKADGKHCMQSKYYGDESNRDNNSSVHQTTSDNFFEVVSNPLANSTAVNNKFYKRFPDKNKTSGGNESHSGIDSKQNLTPFSETLNLCHGKEEKLQEQLITDAFVEKIKYDYNSTTASPNSCFNDIDSQYFQLNHSNLSHPESMSSIQNTTSDKEAIQDSVMNTPPSLRNVENNLFQSNNKSNLFDEYYFPEMSSENQSVSPKDPSSSMYDNGSETEMNVIDDQYFGKTDLTVKDSSGFSDLVSAYNINKDISPHISDKDAENVIKPKFDKTVKKTPLNKPLELKPSEIKENVNIVTNRSVLFKKRAEEKSTAESTSAFDLAMKIRADITKTPQSTMEKNLMTSHDKTRESNEGVEQMKKGRLDSKGFRILSDQVLDLDKMPSMDILEMLKKSIVFDHEDFIVIDKPYGLPSIGQMNDTFSLSSLLPALGRSLPRKYKASDLHIVQGLDRDVTGNVMLAKNPEVAYVLKDKFEANEVIQRYWAITKGVPTPKKGMIDIPIGVGKVGNIYKMVLRPQYQAHEKPVGKKASRTACDRAVTEYSVLSSHMQAALVECCLHTSGVKHQIRVHLSSGLNTPILGDHKYSHFSKLAPQKLDRSTLELLRVRQAKVRHISLHLHCQSLVLPDYKSRTYVITSHLPSFFAKNMKSLKLYFPKK